MRAPMSKISIAANTQKIDVDNRMSLHFYYRLAGNMLKQANIYREEKNLIDLYIILLRFSSLISETIPQHRDFKQSHSREKVEYRKKLLDVVSELELLKPEVQRQLDELNKRYARVIHEEESSDSSLEWPPRNNQVYPVYENGKGYGSSVQNNARQNSWKANEFSRDQRLYSNQIEQQFNKLALNIPRAKEETLSRHSFLGPNGLRGQWQAPTGSARMQVQYPSQVDLTPIQMPCLDWTGQNSLPTDEAAIVSTSESTLPESILSLDTGLRPAQDNGSSSLSGTIELCLPPDIIRQPSPPPILAPIQNIPAELDALTHVSHLNVADPSHAWLNFRGINYSAEVYLNGHKKVLPKGMFRRHTLDVTDILHSDGDNFLAVLVHPPDHPGRIPIEGGQGGDHDIGKDVATQYVQGWDWMAPIRDRNTGIWDEVSISFTGPVKISDPHLVSSFFDDLKRVYLHTTAEFTNASSLAADCTLKVQVSIELEDGMCLIEHVETQELAIPGGTSVLYTFQPLFFYRPSLWWPNGLGKQALYKVDITVDVKEYGESDSWSQLFGFRKIDSHIDPATGGRLFKVNGEPVFIRGGNWILSDGLLRLSEKRYKTDIKFHAEMNFNMIRCWGGGLAERPEFYHYCDVYGLLVWQEFWITGDVDGRGVPVSNPNGPLDHNLFLECARDTIKLLRNHASLALWVGGNEQHPPEDINTALKNDLQLHPFFKLPGVDTSLIESHSWTRSYEDPSRYLDGTRLYIQGSLWDGFANGKGDFTDGPYEIQYPEDFFKDDFYKYGFNPEVGSVGIPVAATIKRTMPQEAWQIPLFQLSDGYISEVPNPVWDYHKYIPYSKPGKVHNQIEMYGEPKSLDDFCEKAQLVNYIQYRALLEGWTSWMWTKYTGVLIWKTQNPWTGLRGQFYDHFHDQTAGFYGARSAAEPIHVQLNLATYFVEIVNTTSSPLSGVIVDTSVWELEGSCPYHKLSKSMSVPPKKTLPVFEMEYPKTKNAKPVYFLLLKLLDKSNSNILSRNFYWLHLAGGDYKPLEAYRSKTVPIRTSAQVTLVGQTYKVEMKVHNLSKNSVSEGQSLLNIEHHHNQQEPITIENMTMKLEPVNEKMEGLLSRISSRVYTRKKEKQMHVAETKGDHSGVAFFLHFSVHAATNNLKTGEDTRILPVHYSDNYFSLVPGEVLPIDITFEVPKNTVPKIVLQGWNTNGHPLAMQLRLK